MVPLQRSASLTPTGNPWGRKTSPSAPIRSISSAGAHPVTRSTTGPAPNASSSSRTATLAVSQPRNQKPPSKSQASSRFSLLPAGALHRIGAVKNFMPQRSQIANSHWRLSAIIVAILLALGSAPAPAQQGAGARQVFDGKMLPDVEVATFEHSDALFSVNIVSRKGPVRPLPPAATTLKDLQFKS